MVDQGCWHMLVFRIFMYNYVQTVIFTFSRSNSIVLIWAACHVLDSTLRQISFQYPDPTPIRRQLYSQTMNFRSHQRYGTLYLVPSGFVEGNQKVETTSDTQFLLDLLLERYISVPIFRYLDLSISWQETRQQNSDKKRERRLTHIASARGIRRDREPNSFSGDPTFDGVTISSSPCELRGECLPWFRAASMVA